MPLPKLNPGTAVFIPRQGVFTVISVRTQTIGGTTYDICDLRHYFDRTNSSRAIDGMERAHVRAPTMHQTAYDIVQRLLHTAPKRRLQGPWTKQRTELEHRLNLGTLEKNLEVVRLLHHIDQDRWKAARTAFYHHAIKLVAEELAFVFDEPLSQTNQMVVQTLNKTMLTQLA